MTFPIHLVNLYPDNAKYGNQKYVGTDCFAFDCIHIQMAKRHRPISYHRKPKRKNLQSPKNGLCRELKPYANLNSSSVYRITSPTESS